MITFQSKTIQLHIAKEIDGEYFYLILKRSESERIYPGIWQVVTGTIEDGEKAIDAAKREMIEETAILFTKFWTIPYVTFYFDPYKDVANASPVFGALVNRNSNVILSEEHSDYKWERFDNGFDLLSLPSHKQAMKIFLDFCLNNTNQSLFEYKA